MEAWQQRVVDEKAALDVKIEALGRWLAMPPKVNGEVVDPIGLEYMRMQLVTMDQYSGILGMRIARFK
jgi:hypothetical protein